jgi:Fur family ferric uptake transcriptional regulator
MKDKNKPDNINTILRQMNCKMTGPRKTIIERFIKLTSHISPEEFYLLLKKDFPTIGRATVYRTLKLLTKSGLAESLSLDDGITRFEIKYNRPHHDHLRCVKCGKIEEFTNETIEELQNKIIQKHRFSPMWHKLEIYGACEKCGKKK